MTIRQLHAKRLQELSLLRMSHGYDMCCVIPCATCEYITVETSRHLTAIAAIDKGIREYGIPGAHHTR